MSQTYKRFVKSGGIFMLVFVLIFLNACSLFKPKLNAFEQTTLSEENARAEDFLPADTILLAEMNLGNESQKQQLQTLVSRFPVSGEEVSLKAKLEETWQKNAQALGLNYEQDIKPLIKEDGRVVLAGKPAMQETSQKEAYIVMQLKDKTAFDALLDKMAGQNESMALIEHGGNRILFDNEKDYFLLRIKDLGVGGAGLDSAKALIDRYDSGKEILADSKNFRDSLAKLPVDRLGFAFINVGETIKKTKEANPEAELGGMMSKILGEAFVLIAEEKGFALKGMVLADEKSDLNFNDYTGESTLYKVVPGKDLIAYFESYNLQRFISNDLKQALAVQGDSATAYANFAEMIKKVTELDLEQDILAWMNKGYAISLQNNLNQIIPGISIIIDSSDTKKAADLARSLDAQISSFMPFATMGYPELAAAINHDSVVSGDKEMYFLEIDFSKLFPEDVESQAQISTLVPETLKDQKFVLYYGLAPDGKFVLSTYHNFLEEYEKDSLAKHREFKDSSKLISDYPNGVVFADPSKVVGYLESLVKFVAKFKNTEVSQEDQDNLNLLNQFVAPIQSLIVGSKMQGKEGEFMGYLTIEE